MGARCLRDYSLQGQIATGGLHGVWKVFAARSKKDGEQSRGSYKLALTSSEEKLRQCQEGKAASAELSRTLKDLACRSPKQGGQRMDCGQKDPSWHGRRSSLGCSGGPLPKGCVSPDKAQTSRHCEGAPDDKSLLIWTGTGAAMIRTGPYTLLNNVRW